MKIYRIIFFVSLLSYVVFINPFVTHLKNRPLQLKVGYVPEAKALKIISADQRYAVADWLILKVLFYFGTLIEKAEKEELYAVPPDYLGMFRILQTGLRLEPYNADAYYFVQSAFTWELGRYTEVNDILEYGMKYRTWDAQLPFFIGFNSAYFLKDYKKAAEYMKKAAEIAHEQQFATLAARYFYEAGETEFGILFVEMMKKSAKDQNEKKLYELRYRALVAVKKVEDALRLYQNNYHSIPDKIQKLVDVGLLSSVPRDPYGGKFYIDSNGKVRTTSKLSLGALHGKGSGTEATTSKDVP